MRIGLLNNLRAGKSGKQVTRLLSLLRSYPEVAHVETDSAGAVPEALSDLSRQEVDLIVVNGGDGTLQHALTEILSGGEFGDRIPMIAPLRGGRTNMTARDLGAQRDPLKGLAELMESARAGTLHERIVARRVLRVDSGPGSAPLYGMFCGVGVIHRAIALTHRVFPREHQGVLGATLITAALVSRAAMLRDTHGVLTPDKVQVLLDGSSLDHGEFTLVIMSSLNRLFARMRPFWGDGEPGVKFTSIATGAKQFWKAMPGIFVGRPQPELVREENGYTSRNVKCAELRMDCGFTVDGELVEPAPGRTLTVTAHDTVRFIRT